MLFFLTLSNDVVPAFSEDGSRDGFCFSGSNYTRFQRILNHMVWLQNLFTLSLPFVLKNPPEGMNFPLNGTARDPPCHLKKDYTSALGFS